MTITIPIISEFQGKGFKQAQQQTSMLDKSLKRLGITLGAALSVRKITQFSKASVKAFIEEDKAVQALARNLQNLGPINRMNIQKSGPLSQYAQSMGGDLGQWGVGATRFTKIPMNLNKDAANGVLFENVSSKQIIEAGKKLNPKGGVVSATPNGGMLVFDPNGAMSAKQLASELKGVAKSDAEKVDRKGWVNYGDQNDFPQYLRDLSHESPVHGSLVVAIGDMIAGKGIQSEQYQAELDALNIDTLTYACAKDLKLFGGFFIEVIWSNDRTVISKLNAIPFEECRIAVNQEDESEIGIFHSYDWSNIRKKKNTPEFIPKYNYLTRNEEPRQIYWCFTYTGSDSYPRPIHAPLARRMKAILRYGNR